MYNLDLVDYEEKVDEIRQENKRYLLEFKEQLLKEGLKEKTVRNHVANVSLYINEFLVYYAPQKMHEGCKEVDWYLGEWFIRKVLWSSKTAIQNNCASIKKFYRCMLEKGHIKQEDFDLLVFTIKEEKEEWIKNFQVLLETE